MKTKNNVLAVGLLTLVFGFAVGYFAREASRPSCQAQVSMSANTHNEMDGMMAGLQGKTGDDLDKAFLDEMIVHHKGAVGMAETLLAAGTKRPELVKLGNDIITTQTQEIAMMTQWRTDWFGR